MKIASVIFVCALLSSCFGVSKQKDCQLFQTGRFVTINKAENLRTLIFRSDSLQIEVGEGTQDTLKALIKWTGPCFYELTALKTKATNPFLVGKTIKTEIIKTGKDYFIIQARMEEIDTTIIDTLYYAHK